MTAADRQRVRQAIDAEQRARREARIHALDLTLCPGCGAEPDTYITGCKNCWDRKHRANRKTNGRTR